MMRPERRELLDTNLLQFSKQLKIEKIMELLLDKNVFNDAVMDQVYSCRTERERRKEIVRSVQRRGDVAYEAFYNALTESGQVELAALMEPLLNGNAEKPILSPSHQRQRRATSPAYSPSRRSDYSFSLDSYDESVSLTEEPISPRLQRRELNVSARSYIVDDCSEAHTSGTMILRRRGTSPPTYSPTRRDSALTTSLHNSYQEAASRARSLSRGSRAALQNADRLNYQTAPPQPLCEPKSPTRNFCSVYNLRSALNRKVQDMSYVFQEDSMNYVDAPYIQRVFDKDTMYPNFTSPRGLCLIINNEHFEQMPTRNGTKTDKENISNLFKCMGYTIVSRDNLTAREILQEVHTFAKDPSHRRCASAIIVILSHGEDNQIIGVDDQTVNTHNLLDLLSATKAPLLANKPKLVFVQACRGERRDVGFPVIDATDGIPALLRRSHNADKGDGPLFNFLGCVRPQVHSTFRKKPEQADILVAYATTSQYVSWRNSVRGSWFIQAICEVFSQHATDMDIIEMLTEVNKKVACGFQTSQGSTTLKQMPELTSRLVKKFYFWPCRTSPV